MYPLSIIIFFALCYGFGHIATFFVKNSEDFFERHLMRVGVGLGTLVVFGYALNLLRIPLDYRIFLSIACLCVLAALSYDYWKTKAVSIMPTFNLNVPTMGMLVLFFLTFYMYHTGAFSYPYLENDDPWMHAVGVKYVSMEKTLFAPQDVSLRYMDPYPPAYDLVMGILHQTNASVMWTLKYFNALIISLGIVFFYFFARQLTSSSKKAFLSTLALFAMPAFMSHFIWAISLTMPLFFVAFYCLERVSEDRRWMLPSALVVMAALTSSPSHSVYFGLFLGIYLITKTFSARRFLWDEYFGAFGGAALSFVLWWLPEIFRRGLTGVSQGISGQQGFTVGISGTADRQYFLADFLFAQKANLINNPIGMGVVICSLFAIFLILLLIRHRSTLISHKLPILVVFIVLFSLLSFTLSSQYIKFVPKKNLEWRDAGTTPFGEFAHDQFFLLIMLGVLLFLLVLLSFESWHNQESKEFPILLALSWCMLAFYAVNASPFAYRLSPFRAWMILAIPVALIAGESMARLLSLIHAMVKSFAPSLAQAASIGLLLLFAYGIYHTSFAQKYVVNTAQWNPGGFWTSGEEIGGYIQMQQNLPFNAPIISFSNTPLIIAFDKFSCFWCPQDRDFTRNKFNSSPEQIHSFLKEKGYHYLIFDGQTAQRFGSNETTSKINGMAMLGYTPIIQTAGFILLKVP